MLDMMKAYDGGRVTFSSSSYALIRFPSKINRAYYAMCVDGSVLGEGECKSDPSFYPITRPSTRRSDVAIYFSPLWRRFDSH
jgi:hypothetical protein